jgi:aspartokinase-like uncharacterized kinase
MLRDRLSVVKVGGSLFDHPGLGPGLRAWLAEEERRSPGRRLLVPGGGDLAEHIRDYHYMHRASEEACHWMAIQAMAINARLLKELLPGASEIHDPRSWPTGFRIGVLNALAFCAADDIQPGALGHTWRVTSDAIAARVAELVEGTSLVLLKSTDLPPDFSWSDAAAYGLVDPTFGAVVARANLYVHWINFRSYLGEPSGPLPSSPPASGGERWGKGG